MCLLIQHYPNTQFTKDHFEDFYARNSDGFGAIVNVGGKAMVIKSLGNVGTLFALYQKHIKGREAVIHFRMATHGEKDILNCHPYEVVHGIYMAHNGVLSTGNSADVKMSDTFHYIQDYLKPILERDPEMLLVPSFQKMLGSHIGAGNRFALMTKTGHVVVINRSTGVNYFNAWLSNTYAWSPNKWGYYQSAYGNYQGYQGGGMQHYKGGHTTAVVTYDSEGNKVTTYPPSKVPGVQKGLDFEWGKRRSTDGHKVRTQVFEGVRLKKAAYDKLCGQMCRVVKQSANLKGIEDWVRLNKWKTKVFLYEQYKYTSKEVSDLVEDKPEDAAMLIFDTVTESLMDEYVKRSINGQPQAEGGAE